MVGMVLAALAVTAAAFTVKCVFDIRKANREIKKSMAEIAEIQAKRRKLLGME